MPGRIELFPMLTAVIAGSVPIGLPVGSDFRGNARGKFSSARSDSNFSLPFSLGYNSAFEKMGSLIIAVGSTRKPKLAAVREALDQIAPLLSPDAQVEIVGIEVESGVAHTPASREALMQGARQRAEALESIGKQDGRPWSYFVGLEGGLDPVEENRRQRVFLESWAYVSDGRRGHFGRSGAVELPPVLADEVLRGGTELSVAIDRFAEQTGIRDAQGAWGVLSANRITRQESFRIAVIAAFAPFYNQKLYHKASAHSVVAR